jgi:hypothetical protein
VPALVSETSAKNCAWTVESMAVATAQTIMTIADIQELLV